MKNLFYFILGSIFFTSLAYGATVLFPGTGGTGWGSLQANTVLLGNGVGRISTTTQGIAGQVLMLSNGVPGWYGTSTVGIAAAGAWATSSDNYNFAILLAGTTTTALSEGNNLYYTTTRFDNRLSASSSISGITTLPNLSLPFSQVSGTITAASSTLLSDTNTWTKTQKFQLGYVSQASSSQIGNFTITGGTLGIGTTSPIGDLVVRGHIQTGSVAVPVVTTCGTTPTINGSDQSGTVIIGGGVISSCQIIFNKPFTNNPICLADDESAILLTRAVATTTGMTLSVATTFQGDTIKYLCSAFE